mmetsp:Transcript_25243/g.53635  ORF Transcript_25243/g.53635 Transcript_25243/m.53635 type:complete len:219 (-) Transcript_25243:488-1144(-)
MHAVEAGAFDLRLAPVQRRCGTVLRSSYVAALFKAAADLGCPLSLLLYKHQNAGSAAQSHVRPRPRALERLESSDTPRHSDDLRTGGARASVLAGERSELLRSGLRGPWGSPTCLVRELAFSPRGRLRASRLCSRPPSVPRLVVALPGPSPVDPWWLWKVQVAHLDGLRRRVSAEAICRGGLVHMQLCRHSFPENDAFPVPGLVLSLCAISCLVCSSS